MHTHTLPLFIFTTSRVLWQDDPKQSSRSEDNFIAYTWRWAYDAYTGDQGEDTPFEVVARMPMTKVREDDWKSNISRNALLKFQA